MSQGSILLKVLPSFFPLQCSVMMAVHFHDCAFKLASYSHSVSRSSGSSTSQPMLRTHSCWKMVLTRMMYEATRPIGSNTRAHAYSTKRLVFVAVLTKCRTFLMGIINVSWLQCHTSPRILLGSSGAISSFLSNAFCSSTALEVHLRSHIPASAMIAFASM